VEHQAPLRPGGIDQFGAGFKADIKLVQLGNNLDEIFEASR